MQSLNNTSAELKFVGDTEDSTSQHPPLEVIR